MFWFILSALVLIVLGVSNFADEPAAGGAAGGAGGDGGAGDAGGANPGGEGTGSEEGDAGPGPTADESFSDFAMRTTNELAGEEKETGRQTEQQQQQQTTDKPPPPGQPGADDLLGRYGINTEGMAPEAVEQIQTAVGSIDGYTQQLEEWRGTVEQKLQETMALRDQLDRLGSDPRFRQAFEHFTRGGQNGQPAPGGQPGQPGQADHLQINPADFETDVERTLYQRLQNSEQRVQNSEQRTGELEQRLDQRLQTIEAGQQAHATEQEQRILGDYQTQIGDLHQKYDEQYPDLIGTPEKVTALHSAVAQQIQAQVANRQNIDLDLAWQNAAKLLDYDNAINRGKTQGVEAAKRAGRQSTLRPTQQRGGMGGGAPKSLVEAGKQVEDGGLAWKSGGSA